MFFADNSTKIECNTQSFSSTDYSRNPDDLGVVFPYGNEQEELNTINVSSIIDHHNAHLTLIKHTESCLVEKYKNDEIKYTRVLNTIGVYIKEQKETLLDLLGKQESHKYIYEHSSPISLDSELFTQRFEIYKEQPTVAAIEESNLKKKTYAAISTKTTNSVWNQWLQPEATPADFVTEDTYSYIKYRLNTYKTATERIDLYKEIEDNIDYEKLKVDIDLPYALRNLMTNTSKEAFVRKLVFEIDTDEHLYYDTNCRKLPKDMFEKYSAVTDQSPNIIQDIPIASEYNHITITLGANAIPIDEVVKPEVLDYILTVFDGISEADLDIAATELKYNLNSVIRDFYNITNAYDIANQVVRTMLDLYKTTPELQYFEEFELPLNVLQPEFVEAYYGKK